MPDRRDALCAAAELILAIENCGANQRRDRYRSHSRHLRGFSRRRQQHSQPGSPQR